MIFSLKILKNYIVRCDFWVGNNLLPTVSICLVILAMGAGKAAAAAIDEELSK